MRGFGPARIHDADAHIFETADWLIRSAEPEIRNRLKPLDLHGREGHIAEAAAREVEAAALKKLPADEDVMARNWDAFGAFEPSLRKHALDLLGFNSQLIFSTYSHLTFINNPGAPAGSDFSPEILYGAVRAHNRGMVDFCSVDKRMLPVGWVAIDVPEQAIACCREALDMGCAGIELPAYPTGPLSLTHTSLHPIYRMLEEFGRPLLFHVGGGGQIVSPVYGNNGRDRTITHELTVIGISAPVEMAVAALVLDGIFEKFPKLMCGVIEHGASWFPGFMRRLDHAVGEFQHDGAKHLLSLWPSEYLRRNVRVTPFPFEDTGWLIEASGSNVFLFGSDYPHDEGGADPVSMFETTLAQRPVSERDQFFYQNYEELMGKGLSDRIGESAAAESESQSRTISVRSVPLGPQAPAGVPASEGPEIARKKALMRLLARDAAGRMGLTAEPNEIGEAVDDFRRQNGLHWLADMQAWMEEAEVDETTLVRILEDGILLDKIGDACGEMLDQELAMQARVASARQFKAAMRASTAP